MLPRHVRTKKVSQVRKKTAISDAKLALYNRLQREKFRAVPPGQRMLFLPHCLRKPKGCRADNTADGLVCKHCSPDCSVNILSTYALSKGYRCFIVPGGEMLFNIVERERPSGIIGVACHHEMGQAAERITGGESSVPFAYQGVPLSKSGCVDTRVDIGAVRAIIDLQGPPPGAAPAARPSFGIPRRTMFKRVGGIAAAAFVALAVMLVLPGMLSPAPIGPAGSEPDITFLSNPSIQKYTHDDYGNTWAVVKASVYNNGPGDARGVLVRATAVYCGRPFEPEKGGQQIVAVNGSIAPGNRVEVPLQVRVHGVNDTSITVETLIRNKVEVIGYIKTPRPVFLRNAGVTGYETSIASGKQANVSVQVFNDGSLRPAGTLRVVASSYTSFNTRWDSAEVELDRSMPQSDTWSFTVQLKVSELDPGHPSFSLELYEGQNANPSDTAFIVG